MKNETSERKAKFQEHPIQLINLGVRELFIQSNRPPDLTVTAEPDACSIKVTSTPYDSKEKHIMVSLKLELGIGPDESKLPYAMRIELIGVFEVDDTRFAVEHVADWAMRGAPIVLYPYLREHAFGLSSRCGFKPLLLPLLEVPTFTIGKSRARRAREKQTQ